MDSARQAGSLTLARHYRLRANFGLDVLDRNVQSWVDGKLRS